MIKIVKILIGILVSMFFFSNTYADENCAVGDTASSLVDYISAERQILSNIKKDLKQNSSSDSKITNFANSSLAGTKAKFTQLFNTFISWDGYFSYFKYYVTFPITQEIPYEIVRDHKILSQEGDNLENFLTKIISNQTDNSSISNPCNGVDTKLACPFKGGITASYIIGELKKNNDFIASYFRSQIIGENFEGKDKIFLLNKESFEKTYTKNIASEYSAKCGSWKKFNTQLKKITNWQNLTKTGIGEWEDALMLLRCSSGDSECKGEYKSKYIEKERENLKNELQRQGLSANATKQMIKNLDTFNSTCANKDLLSSIGCGAEMSVKNSVENIKSAASDFQNVVGGLISNFGFEKNKRVSIQDLQKQKDNNDIENNLKTKIKYLYEGGKSSISAGADNKDKLQSTIIKMHVEVVGASKVLDGLVEKSRAVCNKQGQGMGICK